MIETRDISEMVGGKELKEVATVSCIFVISVKLRVEFAGYKGEKKVALVVALMNPFEQQYVISAEK